MLLKWMEGDDIFILYANNKISAEETLKRLNEREFNIKLILFSGFTIVTILLVTLSIRLN